MKINLYTPRINKQNNIFLQNSNIAFTKEFDVRKIDGLCCPVCASMMFPPPLADSFIKNVSPKKGEELIKEIEKFENIVPQGDFSIKTPVFHPGQKEILKRIKKTAKENPSFDLKEIAHTVADDAFKRYGFTSIRSILSEYQDIENNAREALPNEIYADVFFMNCASKKINSTRIASDFIRAKKPTIEHLIPVVQNGKDKKSNYLCDCNECNAARGSTPFDIWMEKVPDFKENLETYFKQIKAALKDGTLKSTYKNYPLEASQTIKQISHGKINIKV